MRVRTYVGVLLGLVAIVLASYLTNQNQNLLLERFSLGPATSVPLYAVVLTIFLLGFLPTVTVLLVETVKRDLAQRRERRRGRAAVSLDQSFRRAVDLRADRQFNRAAGELAVVLAERPDDFVAAQLYGEVLRRLGRVDEALEVHRQASVEYPSSVALLYQLANDYEARGEPEVAREIRNRVLREFAGMGLVVLRRRRNAALKAGDWEQARELERRLGELDDGAAGGDEEAAIARGLAYQQGVGLLEQDRIEEAIAAFRALLDEERRFIPAAIMLGEAELSRDDEEAAVEIWMQGYRETGSPVFLQRLEDHFIERERPRAAIATLRRLIAGADSDLLPRFFLGRLYYRLEMHDEALKVLTELGERVATSPTYHFLLGRIHQRRGEAALALAAYEACAEQLGVTATEYRCRVCRAPHPDWRDRCEECGAWGAVDLDFEEERVSFEELGVQPAPVWTPPEDWEEADPEADLEVEPGSAP